MLEKRRSEGVKKRGNCNCFFPVVESSSKVIKTRHGPIFLDSFCHPFLSLEGVFRCEKTVSFVFEEPCQYSKQEELSSDDCKKRIKKQKQPRDDFVEEHYRCDDSNAGDIFFTCKWSSNCWNNCFWKISNSWFMTCVCCSASSRFTTLGRLVWLWKQQLHSRVETEGQEEKD